MWTAVGSPKELVEAALAQLTRVPRGSHIALPGGTTPAALFAAMPRLDLTIWQTDERMVAIDSAERNAHLFTHWRDRVGASPDAVQLIGSPRNSTDLLAPDASAEAHATSQRWHAAKARLHLVILGVGADGHIASLFPGDPAADKAGAFVATRAGSRVSMSWDLIASAGAIVVMASGKSKAHTIARALARDPSMPAGRLPPRTAWLLDHAAASELTGSAH